ncbi:hypothetical protein R3P38DRAFT_3212447 [Favolaschia claudopus]|uniref:Uncharacterized protein n=1 Tax=Favolaschia claudopus TaxID=2862362 RepID=A0AAW0AEG3_9AGAR
MDGPHLLTARCSVTPRGIDDLLDTCHKVPQTLSINAQEIQGKPEETSQEFSESASGLITLSHYPDQEGLSLWSTPRETPIMKEIFPGMHPTNPSLEKDDAQADIISRLLTQRQSFATVLRTTIFSSTRRKSLSSETIATADVQNNKSYLVIDFSFCVEGWLAIVGTASREPQPRPVPKVLPPISTSHDTSLGASLLARHAGGTHTIGIVDVQSSSQCPPSCTSLYMGANIRTLHSYATSLGQLGAFLLPSPTCPRPSGQCRPALVAWQHWPPLNHLPPHIAYPSPADILVEMLAPSEHRHPLFPPSHVDADRGTMCLRRQEFSHSGSCRPGMLRLDFRRLHPARRSSSTSSLLAPNDPYVDGASPSHAGRNPYVSRSVPTRRTGRGTLLLSGWTSLVQRMPEAPRLTRIPRRPLTPYTRKDHCYRILRLVANDVIDTVPYVSVWDISLGGTEVSPRLMRSLRRMLLKRAPIMSTPILLQDEVVDAMDDLVEAIGAERTGPIIFKRPDMTTRDAFPTFSSGYVFAQLL